jgi:hypothetical protein
VEHSFGGGRAPPRTVMPEEEKKKQIKSKKNTFGLRDVSLPIQVIIGVSLHTSMRKFLQTGIYEYA